MLGILHFFMAIFMARTFLFIIGSIIAIAFLLYILQVLGIVDVNIDEYLDYLGQLINKIINWIKDEGFIEKIKGLFTDGSEEVNGVSE